MKPILENQETDITFTMQSRTAEDHARFQGRFIVRPDRSLCSIPLILYRTSSFFIKNLCFYYLPLDNIEKSFIIKRKQWRTCAILKIFGVKMTVAEKIALKAGVCRQTVSAVLNGRKNKVRPEKYELILKLAAEFNYQPDLNAKALSGRSMKTIGLIQPSFSSLLTLPLVEAITAEISRRGYKTYILSPRNADEEQSAIREFIARKVDGLMIGSIFNPDNSESYPLPTVVFSTPLGKTDLTVDFGYGIQLAMDHLYKVHGHRRFAFFSDWVQGNQAKYDAYLKFLQEKGLPAPAPVETKLCKDPRKQVLSLIEKEGVTAFIGTCDILPGELMNFLNTTQYRCPEKIAVTGYDGTFLCYASPIQLSAVVHPVCAIAKHSVALLFDKIGKGRSDITQEPLLICPSFFKGQSCGCRGIQQTLNHYQIGRASCRERV